MEGLGVDRDSVRSVLYNNSFPIWHMQLHHLRVLYSKVQHIYYFRPFCMKSQRGPMARHI